ncbi:MAG: hypothetical protein LBL07_01535 [Tannerella sp.]|jgi:hypothetical protein|nr:hypothetical protein [Tannerella sp.]
MAIEFNKTAYTNPKPAFYTEVEPLPGGFKLLQTFPRKFVIPWGTLCQVNYPDLTAAIVKVARVIAGGTTASPRVVKGTMFQVGDLIMKEGEATGKTVTAIDRKNADCDVITFNSALTGLTADDILLEATDTTGSAQKYAPNAAVESTKVTGENAFDATNNPEGGVRTAIDYKMPAQNKATATIPWIDENLATVDVFGDIQAMYNAAYGKTALAESHRKSCGTSCGHRS